jgi:hypothetical protein
MSKKLPTLYAKTSWSCAKKYKPPPYDLLMLELDNGQRVPGWWTGTAWDGRRNVINENKVVAFKDLYSLEHNK